MSFGPRDPRLIDIDEFIKLDFNRVIDDLKVENDILKKRLEVMEKHIGRKANKEKGSEEKIGEDGTDSGVDIEANQKETIERKAERLLETIEFYKNETIILKSFVNTLTNKYNRDNRYLQAQVKFNVDALKQYQTEYAKLKEQLKRYKTECDEQATTIMACFKYLQQIKKKYEDKLDQQRILIRIMDDRMRRYFNQQWDKQSRSGEKSTSESKGNIYETVTPQVPENWGLQEKIEYLELKFINENRDRLLNRLLFENEQLKKLIENDFVECLKIQPKKRVRTSEDYYVEYLKRETIHSRMLIREKERLSRQKRQIIDINTKLNFEEFLHNEESCNREEEFKEKNGVENVETDETDEEIIADVEDGSSSTISDEIFQGSIEDLKEFVGESLEDCRNPSGDSRENIEGLDEKNNNGLESERGKRRISDWETKDEVEFADVEKSTPSEDVDLVETPHQENGVSLKQITPCQSFTKNKRVLFETEECEIIKSNGITQNELEVFKKNFNRIETQAQNFEHEVLKFDNLRKAGLGSSDKSQFLDAVLEEKQKKFQTIPKIPPPNTQKLLPKIPTINKTNRSEDDFVHEKIYPDVISQLKHIQVSTIRSTSAPKST